MELQRADEQGRKSDSGMAHSSLSFFKIKDLVQTEHRCETLQFVSEGPRDRAAGAGTTHSGNGRVKSVNNPSLYQTKEDYFHLCIVQNYPRVP